MTNRLDRRWLLKQGGRLAPLIGLGALAAPAAASAGTATPPQRFTLVGSWSVEITFPANPAVPAVRGLFAFTSDKLLVCTNVRVRDLGTGTWKEVSNTGISYTFHHFMYDEQGTWVGTMHVVQNGHLTSANTWTASGSGTSFDTSGNETGTIRSATTGIRF
ncbi:hypothetical protein [Amycolatopsis sp. lyj-90]|uniref:hypothetical protein n=1 Tax=Amycolatopsis sp. lyj-90 TaxID=2789285 RepID=UPI00397DAD17